MANLTSVNIILQKDCYMIINLVINFDYIYFYFEYKNTDLTYQYYYW